MLPPIPVTRSSTWAVSSAVQQLRHEFWLVPHVSRHRAAAHTPCDMLRPTVGLTAVGLTVWPTVGMTVKVAGR